MFTFEPYEHVIPVMSEREKFWWYEKPLRQPDTLSYGEEQIQLQAEHHLYGRR